MSTTSTEPATEHTSATYKAIQVTKPGEFETVMKPLADPDPHQVRIRVEACGVCHSDPSTVERPFPSTGLASRGREAVGRIDAFGAGVQGWTVGHREGRAGAVFLAASG